MEDGKHILIKLTIKRYQIYSDILIKALIVAIYVKVYLCLLIQENQSKVQRH